MSKVNVGVTNTFGDCDGNVLNYDDPIYIRESALGHYPADVKNGHRNATFRGVSLGGDARINFYGGLRTARFQDIRRVTTPVAGLTP